MPSKRKPTQSMTDSEMIDFLEQLVKDRDALLLHNYTLGSLEKMEISYPGLGLLGGQRTLRQAIASCAGRRYAE